MNREETLRAATAIVTQDRNSQYGEPEDVFQTIANLWTAYSGIANFTKADVALLLALLKIARLRHHQDHADSWTDLAGYAACGAEVATK